MPPLKGDAMKILKRTGVFFLGILVIWGALAISPKPQQVQGENLFRPAGDAPLIIAHRGGYAEFPESTMEAYCHAYNVDSNIVFEADVVLTQDDVLVISHDRSFDRNSDLPPGQPVREVTYQSLIENKVNFAYKNQLDKANGTRQGDLIPYTNYLGNTVTPLEANCSSHILNRDEDVFLITTVEELLRAFPNQRVTMEIKQSGEDGALALEALLSLLDQLNAENPTQNIYPRVALSSFHRDIYDRFVLAKESTHEDLLFSPQNDVVLNYFILHLARLTTFFNAPVASLQVPLTSDGFTLSTSLFIKTAQRHNMAVHYWTINDEAVLRDLIAMGVDGIITDRISLMRSILDETE